MLANGQVNTPKFVPAFTAEEALAAAKKFDSNELVIKVCRGVSGWYSGL